jgi:hypothetical protein
MVMTDAASEQGLSAAEAAKRLRELGPPPETSSRSVSSIVAGNVFTLFNAIIGVFFVLMLSLGLFADSVFGLIAIVNSWIGITFHGARSPGRNYASFLTNKATRIYPTLSRQETASTRRRRIGRDADGGRRWAWVTRP